MANDSWDEMTTPEKLQALREMAFRAADFEQGLANRQAQIHTKLDERLERLEARVAKLEQGIPGR